jgi:predicted phage baseplate assembly protein
VALPVPNLDDRRFQDLVDDAKRLVRQRCPEWTDHNVSDPGVTLIEAFAFMVDQLLYRVNRVPDRLYLKFLELLGLNLFPPTAASADVTFWLSAALEETVEIPAGTEVSTVRTDADEAVGFTVVDALPIISCSLARLASSVEPGQFRDHTETIGRERSFLCFNEVPRPDDALYVGLSEAVPSNAVLLQFDCRIEGHGVDPRNPPWVWEAWTAGGWRACDLETDGTGGLNRAGDVIVHVPRGHEVSLVNRQRAGWLRCRVVEAEVGQPKYSDSPKIMGLAAMTIGGTTRAIHAEVVTDEELGVAEGVSGQSFALQRRPVVPSASELLLEVSEGEGWKEWTRVDSFASSDENDLHWCLDAVEGTVRFGPAVRQPDGSIRRYGACPPKGAVVRLPEYRTGGGRKGNVGRGAISVLKSSIPYVSRVVNREPSAGGVDGEDVENARVRGPLLLRTRDRAVTVEDYEQLSREAAPQVARVRCVPADGVDNAVRILVVPSAADDELGRLRFEQLVPSDDILQAIANYLDDRRVIGARILVEPPVYQGITLVARLRARARANPQNLQSAALESLNRYFHPITGGPDGQGWPFGRPVHVGEVYSVLQRLRGTEFVEDVRLFAADPITGERGDSVQRLEIEPNALVFSYSHQVRVETS